MTLVETAKLLAYVAARDGWAASDQNVAAWHPAGTDAIPFDLAIDRVLDHRPAHRIALACIVGNCDPCGPHSITTEEPTDPVRHVREEIRWRNEMAVRYGVTDRITEQSYTLMVQAVGPRALDAYRQAVSA